MIAWQALTLFLVEIDDKRHSRICDIRVQQPNAARLDHASYRGRGTCPNHVITAGQFGLIVRHQVTSNRHQLQSQRGFSTARLSDEQNALALKGDAGRVQANAIGHRRSDRQTHDKARTERFGRDVGIGRADVFCPDHAAMRLDNLL